MNTPLRCSGMARGMVHSANGVPNLVLIYPSRRDGRLSWLWVAGWLHTEISVWHHKFNPDRFAHLSTNRTRRTLTSLIEANALTTMPDHQLLTTTRLVSNYPPNCPPPGETLPSCLHYIAVPSQMHMSVSNFKYFTGLFWRIYIYALIWEIFPGQCLQPDLMRTLLALAYT